MHREELLVLPLDQRDEWFRMHPLLTRWLSADLEETDPERWRAIHAAAPAWWAQHGDIDLAFEHAMATGDLAAAEALVAEHGFTYLTPGPPDAPSGGGWRRSRPTSPGARRACARSTRSTPSSSATAPGRCTGTSSSSGCCGGAAPPAADRLRQRAEVLRITLAREPAERPAPVAEAVATELGGDAWTALALYATGGLRFLAGDDRADEASTSAAFLAEINDMWVHQANCTSARGILADLAGDRDAAGRGGRQAAELLTRLAERPPADHRHHRRARGRSTRRAPGSRDVAAAPPRGRAAEARDASRRGAVVQRPLRARPRPAPPSSSTTAPPAGRSSASSSTRSASRPPDNGAGPHVEALRESVDAARQLPSDPAWALTEAELKVLQHLPTNLTLADIATRLFVSRNTVKSHVAAIYRKLDATSRSDAVDLARQTGLLEDGAAEGRD